MHGVNVNDGFMTSVLKSFPKTNTEKLDESKNDENPVETVTESDTHSCPLCKSELTEAISRESLEEHADYILAALSESLEDSEDSDESEDLDESEEVEDSEEDQEEDK